MAFLGVLFAMLVLFDLAQPGLSSSWRTALDWATWALWAAFVVEFAARLLAAPSTVGFLRRHWLALVMLAVPALRLLRFGALLRVGRALPAARVASTSYRSARAARSLLGSRTGYLTAVSAIVTLGAAQLAWLAEREHDTFGNFGDALIWAASAVVGMQADPVPESAGGRLVMIAAFATGLILIASLAGTVGAFLLHQRDDRDHTIA